MSETIAIRTGSTVSLVKRHPRVVVPILMALGAAEAGARLLAPRDAEIEPDRVDVSTHFSPEEIERGRRFARPQMALALCRTAVDGAALAAIARRPPRRLLGAVKAPIPAGAAASAGMSLALTLPSLPLAAVSRRRAVKVGLITQSWRGW